MNVTRFARRAALSIAAAGMLLGAASPAVAAEGDEDTVEAAATYPYRNWSQTTNNSAGVRFTPYGDHFEIWDNVNNGGSAFVEFNYKDVNDSWKYVVSVTDGYATVQRNVYENYNGNPAYIYFRVCDYTGCSKPSYFRTWGD
jgi:hypothetical protein